MKREIKFRAYHNRAKKMLESGSNRQIFSWQDEGQDITIMQFTGIRDSRGVELYEGDIVNFGGNKHIVSYEENRKVSYGHGDCGETFFIGFYIGYSYGRDNKFFVLGNIYENPELLEKDENS